MMLLNIDLVPYRSGERCVTSCCIGFPQEFYARPWGKFANKMHDSEVSFPMQTKCDASLGGRVNRETLQYGISYHASDLDT